MKTRIYAAPAVKELMKLFCENIYLLPSIQCPGAVVNPLPAGAAYIRVFIFYWHIKYHLLKRITSILSNLNNFHSLEVVDRVSETQLHVGENQIE